MKYKSNITEVNDLDNSLLKAKQDLELLKLTLKSLKNDASLPEWISVLFIYQELIQNCENALLIFDNSTSNITYISHVINHMIETCIEIMLAYKNIPHRKDYYPYTEIQKHKLLDALIKSNSKMEKMHNELQGSPQSTIRNSTPVEHKKEMLTEKEAAIYISMSVSFLRRSRMEMGNKCLPPYLKIGKAVRYQRGELDKWLNSLSQTHIDKIR